jgi:hypothetical protein
MQINADHRRVTEEKRQQTDRQVVFAYIESLSPEECETLEAEALAQAKPFFRDGYMRSLTEGTTKRTRQYREIILEAHVRTLLESAKE